jgi:uncharacterized tellurite resistance protein B-like protein
MILDRIRSLFFPDSADAGAAGGAGSGDRPSDSAAARHADPLHLAACALLLEVAYADGEFTGDERSHLEDVLERHFSLPPNAGKTLIELADAERRRSIDHFRFTSVLLRGYDEGQKMVLAEAMWGLVLADGRIAEHEHYLTRKIANLLELHPGYLSQAKAAAARRTAGQDEVTDG